jgi:iron complex outermembrane recepter protein
MNLMTRKPTFAAACSLLAFATSLAAQTAPTPPAGDDVVKLSEFSVSAEPDRGYVASETMTGTRVATKIIDLPYTVNVLTSEFFEDFAMFELADNLTQIGSFTGLDIGGGFTLRGFSATSQLRDGFYRLGRYGSSNVDRLEVIKGSNAAIYGRTSPGGMINFISKMPKNREYYKLDLSYGSFKTQRGVLEATGPLFASRLGKTSYILTLSNYQRGFDQDYARNHNDEYYLAIRHVFADNSALTLQAEYFHQTRHAPTTSAPLVTDQKGTADASDDVAIGYAKNLAGYNPYGPNSELNRGNTGVTATYEKKFTDVWSARLAGNYFRARRWDYNQNTGWGAVTINAPASATGVVPAVTTTRGATPSKGLIMEDGGGVQADALSHFWMAHHTVENRVLATIDFNDYYRWDPSWNYGSASNPDIAAWSAATSGRVVTLDANFRPIAPLTYFPKWFQWGNEQLSRLTRRRTTVLGGLLREQAALFNGRLLAYAGVRFDDVRFQERDFRNSIDAVTGTVYAPGAATPAGATLYLPGAMIRRTVTQTKPNVGLNYKVTPALRAFANYSESYFVNQTDNPETFAPSSYKPEVASGYDYGFKGTLLNDKLNFTLSGFYATRKNVSVSDTFESPLGSGLFVTQNRRDGDQLVRGAEADLNWRITDEFSLNGSYGHVHSVYTNFGSASPLAVGRLVSGVSPDNGSISVRYAPGRGALKGFSTNLGVTYIAATPTENPNAGDTYTTNAAGQRVLTRTTYQWRLQVPSFTLWNAGIRYTWRMGRWDHKVALNVNNVFDKDYLKVNRNLGERRGIFVTYTLGFAGAHR